MVADRDEEPHDWRVVYQGPKSGGGAMKGKKGNKRKMGIEAAAFCLSVGLLFKPREATEQYLWQVMGEDSEGDPGDDEGNRGYEGNNKGAGVDKGRGKGAEEG